MDWRTAHFTQVAFVLGGTWLAAGTALAAQFGGLGIFNGELLVTSRMPYAMARDGLLPQRLARLHPRYQTPHVCLVVQAILYSVLTFFLTFTELLMVSTWLALPAYVLTFLTPIILRWKRPEIRGRFRIPGGWPGIIVTALSPILIALYALFEIDREHILRGLAFMATGPVIYFLSARRRLAG
jgi:amino acid transporter